MIMFIKKCFANLMGYFWMPCPLCGKYFGGFEIGNKVKDGKVCCKRC